MSMSRTCARAFGGVGAEGELGTEGERGGGAQVSAGYDAHWRDPLAGLQMRTSTYHRLARQLAEAAQQLCGGRVVFLLEGGYDLKALGASVADSFRGLLGEPSADSFDPDLLRDEPVHKACQPGPVPVSVRAVRHYDGSSTCLSSPTSLTWLDVPNERTLSVPGSG